MNEKLKQLREKAASLHAQAQAVMNTAEAEKRSLTDAEKVTVDNLTASFDATMADIKRNEVIEAQAALLSIPQARMTEATNVAVTPAPVPGATTSTGPRITAGADNGTWGFENPTQFFNAVAAEKTRRRIGGMSPDRISNAVSTYSSEGTNADGGYALPPDFRAGVRKLLDGPDNLFAVLDQIQTPNFTVTLPTDEDPPWSSAGLAAAAVSEGAALTPVKPVLKQWTASLAKYGDLAFVSEEMLADGTLIGPYIQSKIADKLGWKINSAVFTALTGAGSKIDTSKGATGAGAAPTLLNVQAMWVNMLTPFRRDAIWLANPALETVFQNYTIGNWPAYLPPGGLSASPYAVLLGKRVIFTELCAASGTTGDLVLFSPSSLYGVSKTDGLRADTSIHFAFDQDLTAFRFYIRAVAKSKWSAAITRPDSTTASNIVTLASR